MAGVNLIQAVINHANVRLTFSPERLKVSPLQRAHGQNHGHHHTRGQLLPPPMHYGARRGTALPCSAGFQAAMRTYQGAHAPRPQTDEHERECSCCRISLSVLVA